MFILVFQSVKNCKVVFTSLYTQTVAYPKCSCYFRLYGWRLCEEVDKLKGVVMTHDPLSQTHYLSHSSKTALSDKTSYEKNATEERQLPEEEGRTGVAA